MDKHPGLLHRGSLDPQETLREIQINLLECKVCFETFCSQQRERRPQNLSCGHVLCLECVTALSHPLLRKLECPFCRQLCSADSTSHCQVLSDLQELLLSQRPSSSAAAPPPLCRTKGGSLSATGLRLCTVFGGWGTLVNPTGIAAFGSSGAIVVVHDRAKRVVVFNQHGRKLNSFGRRGEATGDICYPVDVAVAPTGCVVVTDAGAKAVKVFTSRGNHMVTVKGSFQVPWGVDTNGDGHILVSDVQAGTLSLVKVDYSHSVIQECCTVISNLQHPKAVACCRVAGYTAVMEHPTERHQHRKLKVFTKDFHLLYQMDSFSLNLQFGLRLNMSGLAFDRAGEDVLLTDSDQGLVCRLGKLQNEAVLSPLVGSHLVRQVGLVALNNTFIILDGGDHCVKIYSV